MRTRVSAVAGLGTGAHGLGRAWQSVPLVLLRCASVFLLTMAVSCAAGAVDSTNELLWADDWLVRSWQTKDGLPQSTVNAIVQTRDGYLWVGTSGGLARFDGVRFRTFGLQDGLRSVRIAALLEDPRGVLWVGTTGGGVSRWENGRLTPMSEAEEFSGADVQALAADMEGTLWVGTEQGLLRWRDGAVTKIGPAEGLPAKQIRALLLDARGALWVSVMLEGLFQGTNGRFAPVPATPSKPGGVYALLEDRGGSIWAGSEAGCLWQWRDRNWKRYDTTNGLPRNILQSLARDTQGMLWVGARNSGLYCGSNGSFQRMMASPGLLEDSIRALCVDREGAVWVGTVGGGLNRLSRRMLHQWGKADGLLEPSVASVAEDAAGSLWVATQNAGPWRFEDRRFTKLNDPAVSGKYPHVYSALGAEDGSVWMAGEQFLLRFRAGQTTQAYLEPPVRGQAIRAMCSDGTNLWLGTYYSALLKLDGAGIRVMATNGTFGGHITSLASEAPETLWVGSAGGLHRWERGSVRKWTTPDGLLTAYIQALHRDPDGTLWIGTLGGGLSRLKHGRFANITARQGLIDDSISQILPDDFGHLWLGCNRGIMRLERKELDNCADGRTSIVYPTVFGQEDGMLSEQCSGGHSPTALKTWDGRLLFPTLRGFVEIDPRRLEDATTAPPQAGIEEIFVDDRVQSNATNLVVGPGHHHVDINYTAPSLRGAEWVRFRHRLEPAEEDWGNAGTRRTATCANLRPGSYVFRVTASDSKGIWNENAASVSILVKPYYWQTAWFRTMVALAVCGGALAWHTRRIARLEQQRAAQAAFTRQLIASQENERARLGRELHDDITQRLACLAMDAATAESLAAAPAGDRMREVRDGLTSLSEDVHTLAYRLHPSILDDLGLAEALKAEGERLTRHESIPVEVKLNDIPESVPRDAALCLYRVAQEALRNAARHAHPRSVRISLRGMDGGLQLAVQDDGCGFDPARQHNRPSLGLASMRERVHIMGGELELESAPGHGSTVLVWVPLKAKPI